MLEAGERGGGGRRRLQAGGADAAESEGGRPGRATPATHLVHGHFHLHVLVLFDFRGSLGFRGSGLGFIHVTFWRKTAQTDFQANVHCTFSGPNQSRASASWGLPVSCAGSLPRGPGAHRGVPAALASASMSALMVISVPYPPRDSVPEMQHTDRLANVCPVNSEITTKQPARHQNCILRTCTLITSKLLQITSKLLILKE